MGIMEVSGLAKAYPGFALGVSFALEEGKITGFIGRNGAGKTTTLKCMLNLVHPDAGSVSFFGLPFRENEAAIKGEIGFVSGGVNFFPRRKIQTITDVCRRFYPHWDDGLYRKYCGLFALDGNKTPSALSEGMKVKYSIALALSHKAKLLLLDEPTSGLDPISRDEVLEIFISLCEDEGITIFFSTHITSDLDRCADRILYIRGGRIRADDPIDHFRSRYRLAELPSGLACEGLVGRKRAKKGETALLDSSLPVPDGVKVSDATLEDIMIHMERMEDDA